MRPIFCGNLDYDVRQSEVERLFKRYGKIDRVDMKSGFCFVYMEDERDAEYAIRRLDRIEFGRKGRRLRVEWTKQERDTRRGGSAGGGGRKSAANSKPSKTLFVINFDPIHTRSRDIERHFEPYGKIVNVRIRRNFAFVQYESEDDAARALDATNMSKLMDRVITVEFAIRDDDDRRNGFSPDRRGRDGSADRGYDRRRSPSPYRRERGSPDYGYRRERESPDYGQGGNGKSKSDAKDSPNYGRDRDVSPANGKYNSRSPPRRGRSRSPVARERSRSPRASLHQRSRDRSPPPRGRSHSPMQERSPLERGERSPLERRERSPLERGERSPLERGERSPLERGERSPLERGERSPSPVARERSRSRS